MKGFRSFDGFIDKNPLNWPHTVSSREIFMKTNRQTSSSFAEAPFCQNDQAAVLWKPIGSKITSKI